MTKYVDFKELRKQLNFRDVLWHYRVELKLTCDQHHGFCPLPTHNGKKKTPSFSANVKRGIWQCFGCGQKGNVLDFAVLMEGGNPKNGQDVRRVALSWLPRPGPVPVRVNFGVRKEKTSNEEQGLINQPLDFELKGLESNHPYLLGRSFKTETITHFGVGYCSRGSLGNRIAIPLHNERGELVGYAGRVIDDESITEENPKYKFPGRRRRKDVIYEFRKSLLLYNANRIPTQAVDLIVVEGFTGVWWLKQAAISDVVAVMGASCSAEQGQIIVSLVKPDGRVSIFTDGDAAGERCAQDIFVHVAPYRAVQWIRLENGKQPTDFGAPELHKLFWGGRT
jgi:DNA primase